MTVSCRRSAVDASRGSRNSGCALASLARSKPANRRKELAAMSHEVHADVLEILSRQLRQYRRVDRIVAECSLILLQPETVEPGRDIQARLLDAGHCHAHLTANYCGVLSS